MTSEDKNTVLFDLLSPAQEHFLKKYLLEQRLLNEIFLLTKPDCCYRIGHPFATKEGIPSGLDELPLIAFFFQNFAATFPFIAHNSEKDQLDFWQQTLHPFIQSFNSKNISGSDERKDNVTKRRQINKKLLLGLLLFYNSLIITDNDLAYLQSNHVKENDGGGLHKLHAPSKSVDVGLGELLETIDANLPYVNDLYINIVAVRQVRQESTSGWSINLLKPKRVRHHYDFVIRITKRVIQDGGSSSEPCYTYSSHFVLRHYEQFQRLARRLKKEYPGVMTNVPAVPSKLKQDNGISKDNAESEQSGDDLLDLSRTTSKTLVRERLRLALRGYTRSLIKYPEIVHSQGFKEFCNTDAFSELDDDDRVDQHHRLEHEKNMLNVQREFQTQTSRVIMGLARDFDAFKQRLVTSPHTIADLFQDIGKTSDVEKLSPLLATFNEWSKLEIAATIYQMFLGLDNLEAWLAKCKKLHSLFPYTIVYGLLKLTNPAKIVSRIVDLLLVEMPRAPWLSSEKSKGARNLLSLIFLTILDDDMSGCAQQLEQLRHEKLGPVYSKVIERIEKYVPASSVADAIKCDALDAQQDLLLTIITSERIEPRITDEYVVERITDSCRSYKNLDENQDAELGKPYVDLLQYWQLSVRHRDMQTLKLLWQEPELTRLIKKTLTIFYAPLINLFSKSNMHIVFLDFQKFLNDMFQELLALNNVEMYWLEPLVIFQRIKGVLDRHDHAIWKFIHDTYVNDEQQLFLGIIKWIEKFLHMLRYKYDQPELVQVKLYEPADKSIDRSLFMRQLESRVASTMAKRELFKKLLESKASEKQQQDPMEESWDQINNKVFGGMDMSDLGVAASDVADIQMLAEEHDLEQGDEFLEFQQRLRYLEKESAAAGTSEMDKLDDMFKKQLLEILLKLKVCDVKDGLEA